jgi:hypothetical protein
MTKPIISFSLTLISLICFVTMNKKIKNIDLPLKLCALHGARLSARSVLVSVGGTCKLDGPQIQSHVLGGAGQWSFHQSPAPRLEMDWSFSP